MICCLNYELQRRTGYKGKNNGIVPCQKVVTVQSWQRYLRVDMKPAMSGERRHVYFSEWEGTPELCDTRFWAGRRQKYDLYHHSDFSSLSNFLVKTKLLFFSRIKASP